MKLKLIKSQRKDLPAIADIYKTEFSKPPYNGKWIKITALKKLKEYAKFCDIWKLIYNNKIVGFFVMNVMWVYPKKIVFGEEIAIKENFKNKGFGEFMIRELRKIYRERGVKEWWGISNKKSKAFKFWKKMGHKEIKDNALIGEKLR